MKLTEISQINESVYSFLGTLTTLSDDYTKQDICARYVATLMVIRDMDMRYKEEDHELKNNTMIDFLYGDDETTKKALNAFKARIDENPRARILWSKYVEQYMDFSFGPKAMRYQIKQLSDYFKQREAQRTSHHEKTLVKNFAAAQEKAQKDYLDMTA